MENSAKLMTVSDLREFLQVSVPQIYLMINRGIAEAETLAKKKLREKNKDEVKVSMTLPGNVLLVGGVTVALSGWGTFDGKYFVEQAKHDVGDSGYTTKIDLRKVLEGY